MVMRFVLLLTLVAVQPAFPEALGPFSSQDDKEVSAASLEGEGAEDATEPSVEERWKNIETTLKEAVQNVISMSYRDGIRLAYEAELSVDCMTSLTTVMRGLGELNSDVVRLLDAWGKIPVGFTKGNMAQLGDYDLCLEVSVRDSNRVPLFHGQYCSIVLEPPLPSRPDVISNDLILMNNSGFAENTAIWETLDTAWAFYTTQPRFGVCLPDQCSTDDIRRLLNAIGRKFDAKLDLLGCEVNKEVPTNTAQITAIFVLGSFVATVLAATILDAGLGYLQHHGCYDGKPGVMTARFRCLSLHKSTAALFRVEGASQHHLKVFNGLRFLGVFWVITFHTYTYPNISTLRSLRDFQKNAEVFWFQFVSNPGLAVDTFFFISGFLVLYNQRNVSEKVSWLRHYVSSVLKRYWRLVPFALLVMLFVFLLPALASGPVWKEHMHKETENCRQRWWSIPAVVNNHYHFNDTCLLHYWYISADLQIYVVVLLLSLLAFRKPAFTITLMVCAVAITMIGVAAQTFVNNYHPAVLFFSRDVRFTLNINRWLSLIPSTHIGPYVIGSLTAFAYVNHGTKKIHPLVQTFLWLLAGTLSGVALFPTMRWGLGNLPSLGVTLAYAATHRVAWALGLSWYVFACATGRGGVLNSILSWNAFVPLGRLSYAIYLVHAYLVFVKAWTVRELVDTSSFNMMSSAISNTVLSVASAYLAHVFLECPLNVLWESLSNWLSRKLSSVGSYKVPTPTDVVDGSSAGLQQTRTSELGDLNKAVPTVSVS